MFNVPPRPQLVNGDNEVVKTSKKENDNNASRENGADEEGEQSAHRSSCDTENPSENGEGSDSETADVEDHTPEDHDGVHGKKTENEGEEDKTHTILRNSEAAYKICPRNIT
nr:paired amphipathic helix protein Sin3-like 4 isoform X1 [Tanacetum cinerariifolium]